MVMRTCKKECRSVAVVVRIVLFIAIPFIYYAAVSVGNYVVDEPVHLPDDRHLARHLLQMPDDGNTIRNCTPAAILEFPSDGLTHHQRRQGYAVIHCLLAMYCFLLLGLVCEHYFVPAIESICKKLNLEDDIAGATFMAAASSSPELFINCVGTFITESDLGVGAVVGSAVFNVLAVPACCGIMTGTVIVLDWWSLSRDCLMYASAVVALIVTLLDSKVFWHEALVLVSMYILYILAMVFNKQLGAFVKSGCCPFNRRKKLYTDVTPLLSEVKNGSIKGSHRSYGPATPPVTVKSPNTALPPLSPPLTPLTPVSPITAPAPKSHITAEKPKLPFRFVAPISLVTETTPTTIVVEEADVTNSRRPSSQRDKYDWLRKLYSVSKWPIVLVLWLTIPDCKKHPRLFPLTFIMCIAWIAGVSYLVAWIITILGDTLDLPDSITGLTILAAGTSLPEAIASVLVTMQGHGGMGISNSIGSNTFDILLCLGLPWLVKSLWYPTVPGQNWVTINSSGISYSSISLLSTLFMMYFSLAMNGYRLEWRVGTVCAFIYGCFLLIATLIELNVFFKVNLPICLH